MAKFDLKSLKSKPLDVQKDINNTEKNRIVEEINTQISEKEQEKQPETEKSTYVTESVNNLAMEKPEENTEKIKTEKPQKTSKEDSVISYVNKEKSQDSGENSKIKNDKPNKSTKEAKAAGKQKEETKAEKFTDLKVASFTLPADVKNFLKIKPKIEGITITLFLSNIIEAKQKEYLKKGIDINKDPDYSNYTETKGRSRGSNPSIVALKIREDQLEWLRRAAFISGMNISRFLEDILRENM